MQIPVVCEIGNERSGSTYNTIKFLKTEELSEKSLVPRSHSIRQPATQSVGQSGKLLAFEVDTQIQDRN